MGVERERAISDAARPNPPRDYRPEELGQEFDRGYNPNGYQLKEKVAAVAKCPTCHKEIALVAKTEEWEQREDATWEHAGWGPATGVCCDNLIVDSSNGYEVYPLPPRLIGHLAMKRSSYYRLEHGWLANWHYRATGQGGANSPC